jgi:ribonuclease J
MSVGERIPGGYVFVDGARVGDVGPAVLREREVLSRDGFVTVNLLVDKISKGLLKEPEIITRGFVYKHETDELFESIRQEISEVVENSSGDLAQEIEKHLKSFLHKETKRRPLVFVFLSEV